MAAAELQVGDAIAQAYGRPGVVQTIDFVYHTQTMYNFTVADAHTYFVGEGQSLVHNECVKFPHKNKVQKAFTKHGEDFGVTGNWHPGKADEMKEAIVNHVHGPNTQKISGTYRWEIEGYHYYDSSTGLWAFTDLDGNFVTGWNIHDAPHQLNDLLTRSNVY